MTLGSKHTMSFMRNGTRIRTRIASTLGLLLLTACTVTEYQPPTPAALAAFENAGPVLPPSKPGDFAGLRPTVGPYRVSSGDVLSILVSPRSGGEAFSAIKLQTTETGLPTRVAQDGTIQLPFAGESLKVQGLTLQEVEQAIVHLYNPKYLKDPPLAFAQVREYQTQQVTVTGGVGRPGRYDLRADRMTLLSALAEAGGVGQLGTGVVRVRRAPTEGQDEKVIVLTPSRGGADLRDIQLLPGDAVEVEIVPANSFIVIGLVRGPGRFDFPPGTTVTLLQALAAGGGVDWVAAPKFARVYRRDAEGNLVSADFKLADENRPLGAANAVLKPGDVVVVEHTVRTAARTIFAQIVRASVGFDVGAVFTTGQDVRFSGDSNR
jgi:protein involved in polysaccharide export with SLBB domain